MTSWPDYELLDCGQGRKLERFGDQLYDRPCPAADLIARQSPEMWRDATARYDGARVADGVWKPSLNKLSGTSLCHVPLGAGFTLRVAPTPAGQIGVFPEQFTNWKWIHDQVTRHPSAPRVLNLFAYTGGSTLAAAVAGAEVTHVDASKPSVGIARENAELSRLAKAPIRWIVEDVLRYCRRELKRGAQYDAVIVDPPSYGHGTKGEPWQLERDLPELLELCRDLTADRRSFFLATCHTPSVGPAELSAYVSDGIVGHCGQPPASGRLWLTPTEGERLESGVYARWPR